MELAVKISVGSLSPTINWTTLKLEEFDLPPFDQQRRIAEILLRGPGRAALARHPSLASSSIRWLAPLPQSTSA